MQILASYIICMRFTQFCSKDMFLLPPLRLMVDTFLHVLFKQAVSEVRTEESHVGQSDMFMVVLRSSRPGLCPSVTDQTRVGLRHLFYLIPRRIYSAHFKILGVSYS